MRSLEREAGRIPDQVERLKYIRRSLHRYQRNATWLTRAVHGTVVCILASILVFGLVRRSTQASAIPAAREPERAASWPGVPTPNVWLVEKNAALEVYSNGLRIENEFATSNTPRRYQAVDRTTGRPVAAGDQPVGIVFHTTESLLAPFEPGHNGLLKKNGKDLLSYVRQHKLYNFVIDRFGRVFRVVQESDAAHHAGHSVWGQDNRVYLNLNPSFLAIAFETKSAEAETDAPQIHAGKVLTEMLRSRYGIPETSCVTHAQVSVNPQNMLIGYHTDWSSRFPFRELGLSDGYEWPMASITVFGFNYDAQFLRSVGARTWGGIAISEQQLLRAALAQNMAPADYRKLLQKHYRDALAELQTSAPAASPNQENPS